MPTPGNTPGRRRTPAEFLAGGAPDAGLLLLRVAVGGLMLFGHGLGKIPRLWGDPVAFADPLGLGAGPSLVLAVLAEVVCAALVILGIGTRLAAVPLLVTMLVAAFGVHAADPFGVKERALLFAVPWATLILAGPGRWSFDAWWARRRVRA